MTGRGICSHASRALCSAPCSDGQHVRDDTKPVNAVTRVTLFVMLGSDPHGSHPFAAGFARSRTATQVTHRSSTPARRGNGSP